MERYYLEAYGYDVVEFEIKLILKEDTRITAFKVDPFQLILHMLLKLNIRIDQLFMVTQFHWMLWLSTQRS